MSSTLTEQHAFPTAALEEHAGQWVAVRDGEVIAAADSLQELRANDDVTREDAVYVVPDPASSFF